MNEEKVAEILNEGLGSEQVPSQSKEEPQPQTEKKEEVQAEDTTKPFVFSEEDKIKIDEILLQADQISDPEQKRAFLVEAFKKYDQYLFTKYTQRRQKDLEELQEYQKRLEEEAKRILLETYQNLLNSQVTTQEETKNNISELENIEAELASKYGPELLQYFHKLVETKTKNLAEEIEKTKREREFIQAQQKLAEKTKNTELPFTPEVYQRMEEWYKNHPEYHQYIIAMNNPYVALEFVYNQVKAEMLPKLIEEKLKKNMSPPPTSKEAEKISMLSGAIGQIEPNKKDEIDTLMDNISKHLRGVYG